MFARLRRPQLIKESRSISVSSKPISVELQAFIARYIQSVEQLEILCLLAENPDRAWSESDVLKAIQSSPESVATQLQYFTREQFLSASVEGKLRFAPGNAGQAVLVDELVKTYRERRVAIVEMIYQKPLDTVRNFADAFRIRREKP
jgi:hypothetical protein